MNVMNIDKRIRLYFFLLAVSSLLAGTAIYIFLRQGTYIHAFLPKNFLYVLQTIFEKIPDSTFADFLRYYFVDCLWCFSLNFSLFSVSKLQSYAATVCIAVLSASSGVLFEILQLLSAVSGTFDFADIVMYIVASICAVMINIKIIKRMDLK